MLLIFYRVDKKGSNLVKISCISIDGFNNSRIETMQFMIVFGICTGARNFKYNYSVQKCLYNNLDLSQKLSNCLSGSFLMDQVANLFG